MQIAALRKDAVLILMVGLFKLMQRPLAAACGKKAERATAQRYPTNTEATAAR